MLKKILLLLSFFILFYNIKAQEWIEFDKTIPHENIDNQGYGTSVNIDEDYAVIGSSGYDNNKGRVFVLHNNGTEWERVAILTASDGASDDRFGHSRIEGDIIVVGAPNNDTNGTNSGSAYIYTKPATGWEDMTETAILSPSDPTEEAWFGYKVDINENTIVIGASNDNENGNSSGSVYIFEKPATGWKNMTETFKLLASDGTSGDRFGSSLSITTDKLVVGAYKDNDKGSIYLYEKPATGWIGLENENAKLYASDGHPDDWFGLNLSVSGNYIVSGAHQNNGYTGSAYVFEKPKNGWENMTESAKLVPSDLAAGHLFGNDVSIYDDKIIVGAFWSHISATRAGRAYLFKKPSLGWAGEVSENQIFTPTDIAAEDNFGSSVFINKDYIAIGSKKDDDNGVNSGSVYFYNAPVEIIAHPETQSSCTGDNITFNVIANNATEYQWQFNGTDITGETLSSLFLTNVTAINNGNYTCVVTGIGGITISNIASLTVVDNIEITTQPSNKIACKNENITFSVIAAGSNLTYQWQFNSSDISGATSSDYTITGALLSNEGSYSCNINSNCGNIVSNNATLTITPSVNITSQPINANKCIGDNVTFSTTAENASAYQWKKEGINISGATSSSYTITNIISDDGGSYTCEAIGTCGNVISDIATLTITPNINITSQPNNIVECEGANVSFTVIADNATGYQWKKGSVNISGATSSSYTITNVTSGDAGSYTCEIIGTCGNVISDVATLTISPNVIITSQPENVNTIVGENVSFSVSADNAIGYQWRIGSFNIYGANQATFSISNVQSTHSGYYSVMISGDCGNIASDFAYSDVSTSIKDLSNYGINIYPNPSNGIFTIEFPKFNNGDNFSIIDVKGNVIYSKETNSSLKYKINLSDYSKGIYFIQINYNKKEIISKLIIK